MSIKRVMMGGLIFWLPALVAGMAAGCGGPPEEPSRVIATGQMSSALGDYALLYKGYANNQVGKLCEDPQNTAGTSVDWKWQVHGVPSDYVPVLMKTDGPAGQPAGGYWRPSAVPQAGEDPQVFGRCDTRRRWPLVFLASHNSVTETNTWSFWTEPLYAGDPQTGTLFTVYFIDSSGDQKTAALQL